MHDHIIKEELSSISLPTTPIIVKQATLECVSVVTSTLEHNIYYGSPPTLKWSLQVSEV